MTFSSLGLSKNLLRAVEEQGYKTPYPIQSQAIPAILQGSDLLAINESGRGETASFGLPILQSLHESGPEYGTFIKALILVPTSDLAIRIGYSIQKYSRTLGEIRTKMVFGGVSVKSQMKGLRGADILVATPERLLELIVIEAVDLSKTDTLVLDATEKLVEPDCRKDLDSILKILPKTRQNLLYCTAFTDDVHALADELLSNPVRVEIDNENDAPELTRQLVYMVDKSKKGPLLSHLIHCGGWQQVLVFTSSKKRADSIAISLNINGIRAEAVYGDKHQRAREALVEQFNKGELRVLVVTDLISRSLELEDIHYVVNYEPPRAASNYIYRISKTAAEGFAISLVCPDDAEHFKMIEQMMGAEAERIDTSTMNLKSY
jgi:ATP-dependent RNA helicase RhlE